MGGWYTREIDSPGDLRGLKVRMPGLGGDVMAKTGASPVSLPAGQIYQNLVSGTIDAAEWVSPYNDYFLKFHEAARYYYYPGMHEPGAIVALGMNRGWWENLAPSEQRAIEAAAVMEHNLLTSELTAKNGEYLRKLVEEHGVELREFSDELFERFAEAAAEVFEEVRAHDAFANRVYESFARARRETGAWLKRSDIAYSRKRNAVLAI